ncbi:TAT-variant-translocated molybdopterin oxidoreductase [Mesonia sp. K7]|uniref:TAT-variant-translocated molybdopterin oxidoreductase n=1 Tax=Mesonia sp. K7 TaxID=2218606 RepID=UPI000DAA627D|nr:TAT-variant-translocated molybdopterin oxidoreductase [Mesonia sp. K7]PZD78775.1 quinol:cytochrome C oxidoreductase [Mesonia sp. K7]
MSSNKKYWKSVEELKGDSSIVETLQQNEFVEEIPIDDFLGDKETLESSKTSRRDFLKFVGFSTAAASLAACEGPVTKSIPYVVQPDEIVPGVANYYATTIADGFDFSSVLIKTREGRPIKVENNTLGKVNAGANARVHASVLSLYDNQRLKRPTIKGEPVAWEKFDAEVAKRLQAQGGKKIVFLTQTFASPSTSKLIKEFSSKYSNVSHVVYDTVSEDAALEAFQSKFGKRALANYDFSKAEVIVSVGADFLGDWQGGGFDSGYAKGRIPSKGKMSQHFQFEANMTISGANADKRVALKPSELKQVVLALAGKGGSGLKGKAAEAVQKAKAALQRAGGKGVVITGLPDIEAQQAVLSINSGSEVMDTDNAILTRQGSAAQVNQLVAEMNAGSVGALMIAGVNPAYSLPNAEDFVKGLKKVGLVVDFAMKMDETAKLSEFVAATPHYLESWGDVQLTTKNFSLMQPTIKPLFDTRQFQESLLKWIGNDKKYHEYIKENIAGSLGNKKWEEALHDGVFEGAVTAVTTTENTVNSTASSRMIIPAANAKGYELTLYTKTALGDGEQANNPWLQELPDPITRTTWDNYLTISKADAEALDLINKHVANGGLNGSYANVKVGKVELKNVPVIIQPGQAKGSVGLALGYGRKEAIQKEMQVGVNAYPLYQNFSTVQNVTIEKAAGEHEFACVQLHNTLMGRGDIVKETTLEIFSTKPKSEWNEMPHVSKDHEPFAVTSPEVDIWDEFDRSIGHHFNLSIDLNACTGCGACVIACHSENNVPVVGKTEVRRSRDMHWLRIDRYYSSEESFEGDNEKKDNFDGLGDSLSGFGEMEEASDSPQVVFQPVMCQHCNHAPCETVCPVAATSHGRQGQNHMAYNRCVGTRYCANNCPYKVRRFNWFLYSENEEFDYNMNNDLGRMVLNPDVTVRSRGVMEKCSMCIQMTQKTILDAKRDGRAIKDGDFQTACSRACSSGAMVFGDINDKESKVFANKEDDRMYHLLEHVGTKPNVFYLTKVRNTTEV